MNHDPYQWGRPSDQTYGQYNHAIANAKNAPAEHDSFPKMNTQNPIITSTSVLGIKYKDGIVMAADNLGSYGSLLRFNNIERLIKVGKETVVGVSGDISDFQQLQRILDELETEQEVYDNFGDNNLRAPHVHEFLSRVLYNRRSKMNPLWNSVIVAGFNDDRSPFLKYIDMLGVTYGASTLATGFGSYLAVPLLRKVIPEDKDYVNVSEEEAKKVIMDSMRVLFYRDARSAETFTLVTLNSEGVKYDKQVQVSNQSWEFAKDITGYGSKQL
ncbi:proteasome endopeptidase complex, beta subunit [Yamadazyma tenuis ATCC 10573]|uniref:Proteasome subunit beta n=1 Tax=Candida tenuis (strain ATCC 10573 / BCRC 21748 / CBS 615 / JCM 9827 / NBRC 10315 / NRRL Y-1498 / VKM Y-70) TaxID=590646 RepID=G3AZN4_CANTC|nr:proteasome endopeptidase complex, beta subunit [Yamadazyma tenuis ATCC 10573]EGV65630.1 proteasome endopeptidase complex, beta subunit [Yamadazyma tenuis ATCC 10573]